MLRRFGDLTLGIVPKSLRKGHWLIVGQTGSGKTVAAEKICEINYLQKHYKVVVPFDAKSDLEAAWCCFPATGKLKQILESGEHLEEERWHPIGFPVRIWHPVCKKLPKKVPEIFFPFTIPLDSISKSELQFLAETSEKSLTVEVLSRALEMLTKDKSLSLPTLIHKLGGMTTSGGVNPFGGSIEIVSRQIEKTAAGIFLPFSYNKFISSTKNSLALTEKKLIEEMNDQKTVSVFSGCFLGDRKSEFFVTIWLLNKIIELKRLGKIRPDICIRLSDLHLLAPRFFLMDYEKVMVDLIFRILTTSRTAGCECICDTQDVTCISQRLAGQFTHLLCGHIWSPSELSFFAEGGMQLDSYDRWTLNSLNFRGSGAFFDLRAKDWFRIVPPLHRHKMEGESFFATWKKEGGQFKDISAEVEGAESEFDEAVKKIAAKSAGKTKRVKPVVQPPEQLLQQKRFTRKDVETVLECSESYAKKAVKSWIVAGLVKRKGALYSKKAYYVFV